jgi:uncharacterized protein YrrD
MNPIRKSREFIGFQIISANNGQVLGTVDDVYVDVKMLELAAITVAEGSLISNMFTPHKDGIRRSAVSVWGDDVILVQDNEFVKSSTLLDRDAWESSKNQIKGKKVLSTNGELVAILDDVLVDSQTKVIGYDFGEVFIKGAIAESRRAPKISTSSFGPDALIIDTDALYEWEVQPN